MFRASLLYKFALLGACLLPAAAAQEMPTRERMLAIAREYADFPWQGDPRNVLHGADAEGTPVDTPDVSFDAQGWKPDAVNRGMPYAWGGFTSIEEFRAGLAAGRPAGQVPTTERAWPSADAMGLDCSGFIARCWELPVKQSTRSLGALCYPLPDLQALQPGDILNQFDSHVVLFSSWADAEHTRLRVFEAARLVVKESEYTAEALKRFAPMRYKPLDERWVPMTPGPATFTADAAAEGRWTADGEPAPFASAAPASPLGDAHAGEWARHRVTDVSARGSQDSASFTLVAGADGGRVDTQTETTLPGGTLFTGQSCEHAAALIEALLDFAPAGEPLTAVTVRSGTVTPGHYELAGRSFPAQRLELELSATHVVRHQDLPVTIVITCVVSPEVAVHGVLEASVRRDTVWSAEPGQEPVMSRHATRFALQEFGGPPR